MVTEVMNALAPDYLDELKKKKIILHRAIQMKIQTVLFGAFPQKERTLIS
jgi:hypothetical protein